MCSGGGCDFSFPCPPPSAPVRSLGRVPEDGAVSDDDGNGGGGGGGGGGGATVHSVAGTPCRSRIRQRSSKALGKSQDSPLTEQQRLFGGGEISFGVVELYLASCVGCYGRAFP